LEKNYKKDMSMDDAISLAISAINLKNDKNTTEDIKMSKITLSTQIIEKISNDELKKYAKVKNDTSAK
jgi:proteasome alpha subunit